MRPPARIFRFSLTRNFTNSEIQMKKYLENKYLKTNFIDAQDIPENDVQQEKSQH